MVRAQQKVEQRPVEIEQLALRRVRVTLVGSSSLICHRFGERAIKKIRDKQSHRAGIGLEARDPMADFTESLYVIRRGGKKRMDEYGFPVTAFKNAAVDACRHVEFISMVMAKGAFHIDGVSGEHGTLVPIITPKAPRMREDTVRLKSGGADLRYRAEFFPWEVVIDVEYNERAISLEQLIMLFEVAGFSIGIGEWRPTSPKKPGPHGRWRVKR
jgi:hypothetical protein